MKLTEENYYTDLEWLSNSRFKAYMACEARALALDMGEWTEDRDETPFLVGNYLHSYFESPEAHEAFKVKEGAKLLSSRGASKGQLKSEYRVADDMIVALENDPLFLRVYNGRAGDEVHKELILTGEVEGVKVKGKVDSINLTQGLTVDLKSMKTIKDKVWSEELGRKVPGVVANILGFGYHIQLGLYQELLRQMYGRDFAMWIAAVSKEPWPDKELISVPQEFLDDGLAYFREHVGRVNRVIAGEVKPTSCESCPYCRSKKKLTRVVSLYELMD